MTMANICDFDMYVRGERAAIAAFIEKAADCAIYEFSADEQWRKEDESIVYLYGSCKWSVQSAMLDMNDGLAEVAGELSLAVEVWSSEADLGFEEHYLYIPGEPPISQTFDFKDLFYDAAIDGDFEGWKLDNGIPSGITIDDLEDGERYIEFGREPSYDPRIIPDHKGWCEEWNRGSGQIAYFGGAKTYESQLARVNAWGGIEVAPEKQTTLDGAKAAQRKRTRGESVNGGIRI